MRFLLITLFGIIAWTQPASACSINGPLIDLDINWRVSYARDGSFKNGGENDSIVGKPVFDLQGGRIGQVIGYVGPCQYFESLLLADCNSLEITMLDNIPRAPNDEPVVLTGSFTVDELLPPNGLLAEVPNKTVIEMRRFLLRHGASDSNGDIEANREQKPRDQFNPFAGCKVMYPESLGATYERPRTTE